jgi:stage II sporulation protein D
VNVLNIEDYLRGVVPNELSPLQFPQIEALKAQAVAARTYALKNMGQYKERGYDICATPACQVYKGVATEHPLTDQAVADTAGVVARFQGELINALFTSTCGGHTEDGGNVFPKQTHAYLKGVPCEAEQQRVAIVRAAPVERLGGEPALNRDVALLRALDIVGPSAERATWLAEDLRPEEAQSWSLRLLRSVQRRGCQHEAPSNAASAASAADTARRGAFFAYLTSALCWDDRARRLLSDREARFLQRAEDDAEFASSAEARAAALLVQEEILTPSASGRLEPGRILRRSEAIGLLARAALRIGPPSLDRAEFAGGAESQLRFRRGDEVTTERASERIRLFRELSGVPVATSELALTQGDRVRYVVGEDGRVAFLSAEQSRMGPSADRSSRFYRWEERLTPDAIAKTVQRYGAPGAIEDLEIVRTGVSGRVVELIVHGAIRDVRLKGLEVRFGLGVRENLFVIDREVDSTGAIRRFIINGKGWGHGVGLCQVGAFGMAQAGATYDQIIRRYYSGVELTREEPRLRRPF